MVVKIICYLNKIVNGFIVNLGAVNFFALFGCYIDNFSYVFPGFEKI